MHLNSHPSGTWKRSNKDWGSDLCGSIYTFSVSPIEQAKCQLAYTSDHLRTWKNTQGDHTRTHTRGPGGCSAWPGMAKPEHALVPLETLHLQNPTVMDGGGPREKFSSQTQRPAVMLRRHTLPSGSKARFVIRADNQDQDNGLLRGQGQVQPLPVRSPARYLKAKL